MTEKPSVVDRFRALVADLRGEGGPDEETSREGDEHVAPLEETFREKQRERMSDVADDLSED